MVYNFKLFIYEQMYNKKNVLLNYQPFFYMIVPI